MPRLTRTIVARIRSSIARRGVMRTLGRFVLLPRFLWSEYRAAARRSKRGPRSEFDVAHGVDTDGERGGWTYLSDLDIPSPNWIHGVNYVGIEPARFLAALLSVEIKHEDFVFIDYGSGKGRALLMASDFPFRRVTGIEFSPELHAVAEKNIRLYRQRPNGCSAVESLRMDFVDFVMPPEPAVLYFYEPCDDVVFTRVLERIRQSLREHPRPLHLIYMAPGSKEALLDTVDFLVKTGRHAGFQFCCYTAVP
jgi:hypothetical protein